MTKTNAGIVPGNAGTASAETRGTLRLSGGIPPRIPPASEAKYDFLVFIGRMRPFHNGHLAVVRRALMLSGVVVILIGSSKQARSPKDPLKANEVEICIRGAFTAEENLRIVIRPLLDTYNNTAWMTNVLEMVNGIRAEYHPPTGHKARIGLIGHSKDQSSFYLSMFPMWAGEAVANVGGLSATPIRDAYYQDAAAALEFYRDSMPESTIGFLRDFASTPEYQWLVGEWKYYSDLRGKQKLWAEMTGSAHEPTLTTVEAVVVQSAHILLIERQSRPGKGLLSLPGGFPAAHESLRAAMVRKVHGETRIKVSPDTLDRCVTAVNTFDYPWRSQRGRVFAQAYRVELRNDRGGLTKIGENGAWVHNAEIDPEMMIDDHYHIIQTMLAMPNQREG